MGIFNFFIVLPEITAALTFGPLVKYLLGGNLVHAVMAGGVFMLLAAVLAQWVDEKPTSIERLKAEDRMAANNLQTLHLGRFNFTFRA
jgi:maltose/moltooligosaccharide transporter